MQQNLNFNDNLRSLKDRIIRTLTLNRATIIHNGEDDQDVYEIPSTGISNATDSFLAKAQILSNFIFKVDKNDPKQTINPIPPLDNALTNINARQVVEKLTLYFFPESEWFIDQDNKMLVFDDREFILNGPPSLHFQQGSPTLDVGKDPILKPGDKPDRLMCIYNALTSDDIEVYIVDINKSVLI